MKRFVVRYVRQMKLVEDTAYVVRELVVDTESAWQSGALHTKRAKFTSRLGNIVSS